MAAASWDSVRVNLNERQAVCGQAVGNVKLSPKQVLDIIRRPGKWQSLTQEHKRYWHERSYSVVVRCAKCDNNYKHVKLHINIPVAYGLHLKRLSLH